MESKPNYMSLLSACRRLAVDQAKRITQLEAVLTDIEEYGTEEINAAVAMRQKIAKLKIENERLREVEQRNDLLEEIRGMRTDIQNVGIAIQNLHPRRGRVN